MAAAAPPPPNLDAEARQAVARACDALITRQQLFAIFDEKVGAADYARWRRDLIAYVASAGQDFVQALLFGGVIPAPAQYVDAQVTMDTAAGRPQLTMPQMRQQAMLSVIRCTLQPGGESLRLIALCTHAGGMIAAGGVNQDQALRLLDTRWHAADTPEYDLGSEARTLHTMTWPPRCAEIDMYRSLNCLPAMTTGVS